MAKARRLIFHVYLALTLFGMTVGTLYFLLMRNDFLAASPNLEPYFTPYVAAAILTSIGAVALLRNQRWGFWAMLAGFATAFGIETMAGQAWEKIARIPIAVLVLFLLTRWNKMI